VISPAGGVSAPGHAVIHVGAPKTATTFIQDTLWANKDALRQQGIDMLGTSQRLHYRAGKDLLGVAFNQDDPGADWTGEWDRMCSMAHESDAETVVISDEHLAAATIEQARRAAAGLAPREVHVVYCARGLADLLPSEWQEFVKHGSTMDFPSWLGAVLSSTSSGPGAWFWRVHDPVAVVGRWSTAVPEARLHLLTMPLPGSPREEVWRRFMLAAGHQDIGADIPATANTSLGLAGVEVLRRVNVELPRDYPRWHRAGLVRDVLANEILNPIGGSGRATISDAYWDEVRSRSHDIVATLSDVDVQVVGSLDELQPPSTPPLGEFVVEDDITRVAVEAIARLMVIMARMRDARRASERSLHAEIGAARYDADHPVRVRVERFKHRVVDAEDTSHVIRAVLRTHRSVRAWHRRRSGDGETRASR
jgi:hypothetical protein